MNPIVQGLIKEFLPIIASLVSSFVIPKIKRKAFERMADGLQEFSGFVLDQKAKVEATATTLDDEAYQLSKEAFKKFLDETFCLYEKM